MAAGSAGVDIADTATRWAAIFDSRLSTAIAKGSNTRRALEVIAGHIRREVANWTSETPGRKTGTLSRSFRPRIKLEESAEGSTAVFGVFSGLPYASIHETGGVIRPKRAKRLAIPLTPEARRAGSPRAFPRKLVMVTSRRGSTLLVESFRSRKTRRIKPQYLLVSSTSIRAKHYITKAREASEADVTKLLGETVKTVVQTT